MMSREEAKAVAEADYRTSLGCDHTGGYAGFVYIPPSIPPLPPITYIENQSEHEEFLEALMIEMVKPIEDDQVNHPKHYSDAGGFEPIKVIEAWELGFCLGNTVKYISRAGKKAGNSELQDLQKAAWYLQRRIEQLEQAQYVDRGKL